MRRCKILAPRKEAVILDGIQPTDTFGALRARAKVELKSASQHSLLLLHGQQMADDLVIGEHISQDDEVLFFVEVTPPEAASPMRQMTSGFGQLGPAGGRGQGGFMGMGMGGAGRGIQQGDLANILDQLAGRGRGATQPQRQPQQGAAPAAARPAQPSAAQRRPAAQQVPQESVQQLTEMGFSQAKAIAALKSNANDFLDAVNWLDEKADEPESYFAQVAAAPAPGLQASAASASTAAANVPVSASVDHEPSAEVNALLPIFDPVFKAIALVANGENRMRNVLEIVRLPAMERDGWTGLSAAVGRIWAGSRDAAAVCVGLDKNTAFFVRKILEYVEMGKDRLAAISDSNVRSAMPVDAEFDLIAAQFRPYLDRMVRVAVKQTKISFGEGEEDANDAIEEKATTEFVDRMEGANWQIRAPYEMLCAGVRSEEDLLECIGPLPDGKPDDRSARLSRTILESVVSLESNQMEMS